MIGSSTIPDKYAPLFGEYQGIFQSLNIVKPSTGDWPFYYGGARVCDVGRLNGGASFRPPAGGISTSYEQALMSIIGEGIERYCASFPQREKLLSASAADLKGSDFLAPKKLSCYSEAQHASPHFPFARPTPTDPMVWTQAQDLYSTDTVLVPANRVYIPYYGLGLDQIPGNSTGLACGADCAMSTQNAICEVLERDAYSLCWLFAGTPPKINLESLVDIKEIVPCIDHADWHVECYDLTGIEAVPILLIVLRAPRSNSEINERWYCHGVAAHLDPRIALTKAFREAMLGYYSLEGRWQSLVESKSDSPDVADPVDFDAHALFYNKHPDKLNLLSFLNAQDSHAWGSTRGTQQNDLGTSLDVLLNKLKVAGVTGVIVDLTTDDVRAFGLHVSRVLLQGFSWLHGDNRLPFLGSLRAQQPHRYYDYIAPFAAGAVNRRNYWPHSLG